MNIRDLFQMVVEREASDLLLRVKAHPRARINGKIEILREILLTQEDLWRMTNILLSNDKRKAIFSEKFDVDFIHQEEGIGRFRVNIFIQRGTPAIVARYVHSRVKSFEELNLPVDLCRLFCQESKGLFLVCGPAGNGKSTTIASMIDYVNTISAKHIITIEDPIEYLFSDKMSLINQRELGFDVPTYSDALRSVTQQSPDIIYIGNIRDEEVMRAAITATELGSFVMTTFHTINSVQTVMRIVNFFPPHQHDEVRMQLSMILRGTISLRLLPLKNGKGRVPAFETMVVTPTISRLIRENKIQEIQKYIDEGQLFGMQSFQQSMVRLVNEGLVERDEARRLSDSKDEFDLALKGIKHQFR